MFSERRLPAAALLEKGKRYLGHGRVEAALEAFRAAVDACSVRERSILGGALYWLGLCLLRASKRDVAVRSLASAQKMLRRGHARKTYLHFSNEYGMPRQKSIEDDDTVAFYSYQIALYLKRRSVSAFSSRMERDCVLSTLATAWKSLSASPAWGKKAAAEKLLVIKGLNVQYPMALPQSFHAPESLAVDFRTKRRLSPSDPCACGSGLSFCRCCGRIRSLHEGSSAYF